jgi:hypothetical protein
LTIETDKKGNATPSKKYSSLHNPICGFSKGNVDHYLDEIFPETYYAKGYIKRLRKCHSKVIRELNEFLKTALTSLAITAAVTIAAITTASTFAPTIWFTIFSIWAFHIIHYIFECYTMFSTGIINC